MTPTQARKLALELAAWHSGQGSGLYAVSSTLLGAAGRVKPGARNWPEPVFPADITIRAMRELSDLSRATPGVRARDAFRRMMDGIKSLRTGPARKNEAIPVRLPDGTIRYMETVQDDRPVVVPHAGPERASYSGATETAEADIAIANRERAEAAAHERAAADIERRREAYAAETPEGFGTGTRVEIPAHYDAWMRGDRYGEVIGPGTVPGVVRVKLDKSGKVVTADTAFMRKV